MISKTNSTLDKVEPLVRLSRLVWRVQLEGWKPEWETQYEGILQHFNITVDENIVNSLYVAQLKEKNNLFMNTNQQFNETPISVESQVELLFCLKDIVEEHGLSDSIKGFIQSEESLSEALCIDSKESCLTSIEALFDKKPLVFYKVLSKKKLALGNNPYWKSLPKGVRGLVSDMSIRKFVFLWEFKQLQDKEKYEHASGQIYTVSNLMDLLSEQTALWKKVYQKANKIQSAPEGDRLELAKKASAELKSALNQGKYNPFFTKKEKHQQSSVTSLKASGWTTHKGIQDVMGAYTAMLDIGRSSNKITMAKSNQKWVKAFPSWAKELHTDTMATMLNRYLFDRLKDLGEIPSVKKDHPLYEISKIGKRK